MIIMRWQIREWLFLEILLYLIPVNCKDFNGKEITYIKSAARDSGRGLSVRLRPDQLLAQMKIGQAITVQVESAQRKETQIALC